MCYVIFFFKQKMAYEIKECDWSSDVCSSDLTFANLTGVLSACTNETIYIDVPLDFDYGTGAAVGNTTVYLNYTKTEVEQDRFNDSSTTKNFTLTSIQYAYFKLDRSEERRAGKECRSRCPPYH